MPDVAELVKTGREAKSMTQEALARRVGTSLSTLQRIEAGVQVPRSPLLFAIADALGITVDEVRAAVMAGAPTP